MLLSVLEMNRDFLNVYGDAERAKAYADPGFPGTYYLGFRDLPGLVERHVQGTMALDFGCGTGRSTRFLRSLGFDVVGVDISQPMLSFDNVPSAEERIALFAGMGGLLSPAGRMIHLISVADLYVNEWTSFSTRDFPENAYAKSGELVHIVMLDVPDRRPVEDVLWSDADYQAQFAAADLNLLETHRPLGRRSDPYPWVTERRVSPWAVYVLEKPGDEWVRAKDPITVAMQRAGR